MQMRRAELDERLKDLVDIVYVNAPHEASGPIPDDVAPFFQGPYYEWWNAKQVRSTVPTAERNGHVLDIWGKFLMFELYAFAHVKFPFGNTT
jgi:hypothetical protein